MCRAVCTQYSLYCVYSVADSNQSRVQIVHVASLCTQPRVQLYPAAGHFLSDALVIRRTITTDTDYEDVSAFLLFLTDSVRAYHVGAPC